MEWRTVLLEAGCFEFLQPRAMRATDEAFRLCPEAASLVDERGRDELAELCMQRLRLLYERPLFHAALKRLERAEGLPESVDDLDLSALRLAADGVREGLLADGGEELESELPLAREYEESIVRNHGGAVAEMLGRLLQARERVSSQLLGGGSALRISGVSGMGDAHRHGRSVLRISCGERAFYYKPRSWEIDALLEELIDCWYPDCAVVADFVRGDGYFFAEELVARPLSGEDELGEYWRRLGALAALFHGLGSRDMTEDNILCAGVQPAVLDAETLLMGGFVGGPAHREEVQTEYTPSALNSSVMPWPEAEQWRSPLTTDNVSGNCLPRVAGVTRTVAGFEQPFMDGFAEGYRRLVSAREQIVELLESARSVPCRKALLNTWAYVGARTALFSPSRLADASQRDGVLRWLWSKYDSLPAHQRLAIARADVAAMVEGDIPYYYSLVGGTTLYGADETFVHDGTFRQSALEIARSRLAMLCDSELHHELDLIADVLSHLF